jgi:hypothetical protein
MIGRDSAEPQRSVAQCAEFGVFGITTRGSVATVPLKDAPLIWHSLPYARGSDRSRGPSGSVCMALRATDGNEDGVEGGRHVVFTWQPLPNGRGSDRSHDRKGVGGR